MTKYIYDVHSLHKHCLANYDSHKRAHNIEKGERSSSKHPRTAKIVNRKSTMSLASQTENVGNGSELAIDNGKASRPREKRKYFCLQSKTSVHSEPSITDVAPQRGPSSLVYAKKRGRKKKQQSTSDV